MNWQTAKLICESIALLAVAGSAIFVAVEFHGVAVNLNASISTLNTTAKAAGDTLAALNGPCKDIQGDYVCPPLTQLSQTEKNVGILAAQSAVQVKQTGALITATANNMNAVGDSVKGVASHLDTTADALTGTAQGATQTLAAASTDLKTLDTSLTAFPPLLERSTATVGDLDALLKDKAVYRTLDNVQSMTSSGSAILIDARTLADKTTGDILKPKPWWMKIGPYGNDLVRAGCLLTGRCP